jgi:hypothetical protein
LLLKNPPTAAIVQGMAQATAAIVQGMAQATAAIVQGMAQAISNVSIINNAILIL